MEGMGGAVCAEEGGLSVGGSKGVLGTGAVLDCEVDGGVVDGGDVEAGLLVLGGGGPGFLYCILVFILFLFLSGWYKKMHG